MKLFFKMENVGNVLIPINYQPILTGAIHKWLGKENQFHGFTPPYAFSWLKNIDINTERKVIKIKKDSYWFLTSNEIDIIKTIINGVNEDNLLCKGVYVSDILIEDEYSRNGDNVYHLGSPVLIKKSSNNSIVHLSYDNPECSHVMTNLMIKNLENKGLNSDGLKLSFKQNDTNAKTKIIHYNGIKNKVNFCPIIIEGNDDQIKFAKSVGIGHSTGIGFGSII